MSSLSISIACFLDKDLKNTIKDCFDKAKYPLNLHIVICLQYDYNDNFITEYDNDPQITIIKMHYTQARGPAFARYLCTQVIRDEEYFLQIDAHTRFYDNWDDMAIQCLKECNDKKAILTNLHCELDYKYLKDILPKNVEPAYDGLTLDL